MDAIDTAHGLLSHLFVEVTADHSLQDDASLTVLDLQMAAGKMRIREKGLLDGIGDGGAVVHRLPQLQDRDSENSLAVISLLSEFPLNPCTNLLRRLGNLNVRLPMAPVVEVTPCDRSHRLLVKSSPT